MSDIGPEIRRLRAYADRTYSPSERNDYIDDGQLRADIDALLAEYAAERAAESQSFERDQHPRRMTATELADVLDDMARRVREGDSMEGSIQYLLPVDNDAPAGTVEVTAAYRTGNFMGQGGMRLIRADETGGDS